MPEVNANNIDPDQIPCSVSSDLGLHCLPMSHLLDAMHKWVNFVSYASIHFLSMTFCRDKHIF